MTKAFFFPSNNYSKTPINSLGVQGEPPPYSEVETGISQALGSGHEKTVHLSRRSSNGSSSSFRTSLPSCSSDFVQSQLPKDLTKKLEELKSHLATDQFQMQMTNISGKGKGQAQPLASNQDLNSLNNMFQDKTLNRSQAEGLIHEFSSLLKKISDSSSQSKALAMLEGLYKKYPDAIGMAQLTQLAHVTVDPSSYEQAQQHKVLDLTQAAFDHLWSSQRGSQAIALSDRACQNQQKTLKQVQDLLENIDGKDTELQLKTFKLVVGALGAVKQRAILPKSAAGQQLSAQLQQLDALVKSQLETHQKQWHDFAKANTPASSAKVLANVSATGTAIGAGIAGSVTGVIGGVIGAVGGTLGLARLAATPVFMLGSAFSSSKHETRNFIRHVVSSPVRNAAKGVVKGWDLVDPGQLTEQVFESLYPTHATEDAKNAMKLSNQYKKMTETTLN